MDIVRGSSINHALSGFDVRSTESHLRGREEGEGGVESGEWCRLGA